MIEFLKKTRICNFKNKLFLFVLSVLFFSLPIIPLTGQTITQVGYFDTWQANPQIIKSIDPAGLTYHPPSGHLYIADSEINEIPEVFSGANIFEVSKSGNNVYQEITSGNSEPTGITYNEVDDYFYVSNDDNQTITRYDNDFRIIAQIRTTDDDATVTDPEDITSDPSSGNLYIVDGGLGSSQLLIYNSNLIYLRKYSLSAAAPGMDAEGIAFNPDNRHLLISCARVDTIYEFTTSGTLLYTYDLSGFSPAPGSVSGLTFAPTSDPNDNPDDLALYISDSMLDNDLNPDERDGRIYEAIIKFADFFGMPRIIGPQSEIAFTNLSPTDISSYSWDFGDGASSIERDPLHTYNTAGIYPVSLTVTGPNGTGNETKTDYIRVIEGLETLSFQDGFNGYHGTQDTRLSSTYQSTNFGSAKTLRVDGRTDESTLLCWDLTDIPFGSTIYAAVISHNVTDISNATYEIYRMKRPWIENEATWNDYASVQNWEAAGAVGSADRGFNVLGTIVGSNLGSNLTSLNTDGVALVQSWIDNPSINYGFIFQDYINHSNGLHFSSRETPVEMERPKLTVSYLPPHLSVYDTDPKAHPTAFKLQANYPNPFNPSTTIRFDIPLTGSGLVDTNLFIYNALGQVVKTLYQDKLRPGSYEVQWDGMTDFGINAPSGIYFVIFRANEFSQTEKIVLLK